MEKPVQNRFLTFHVPFHSDSMQFLNYPKDPTLEEFDEVLTWPPAEFYDWLDNLGLIHFRVNCEKCDFALKLLTDASRKEGFRLRCPKCRTASSLKDNSAFAGTREDLRLFVHVAILWKARSFQEANGIQPPRNTQLPHRFRNNH